MSTRNNEVTFGIMKITQYHAQLANYIMFLVYLVQKPFFLSLSFFQQEQNNKIVMFLISIFVINKIKILTGTPWFSYKPEPRPACNGWT